MEHKWMQLPVNQILPQDVVNAAESNNYTEAILVGRAFLGDDVLPATVVPSQKCAFVAKYGRVCNPTKFEVLVGKHFYWQACEDGYFPTDAVDIGSQSTKEQIFIGRVNFKETIRVGRVDPTLGITHFPYNGEEISLKTYDVLAADNSALWVTASYSCVPSDAVVFGSVEGAVAYVGRSLLNGQWMPAKIVPYEEQAFACHSLWDVPTNDFQFLCGSGFTWEKVYNEYIPENAVITGTTSLGEPLYVGRGEFKGQPTLGLISPDRRCIRFCFGARKRDYEVLLKEQ